MSRRLGLFSSLPFVLVLFASSLAAQQPFDPMLQSGDVLTAPEQLRRAAPPDLNSTPELLEAYGDRYRREKGYADALDYYKAALNKIPTAVLQNKIGITYLQMLRHDDAKKAFERAIKLDKNYAEAHNNLGVSHYIKRSFRRAVKEYEKAIALKPNAASFYSNLGTARFARKEYDKATGNYLQALAIDPEIFDRRSNAGVALHMPSPEERAKYNFVVAKMFAARDDADKSLLYLQKAIEEGYEGVKDAFKLHEFDGLRKDPRFMAIMENPNLQLQR